MPAEHLIVGLGNPGAEYERSRHNCGAETVALLARRHGGELKRDRQARALSGEVAIDGTRVALAWPQTYYNDSGLSVVALAKRYKLLDDVERITVVHDELDLGPGRLKVKLGGGLAGNNGLRSIKAHLHSDGFARVRIGVGKPSHRLQGADHVLRRPGKSERTELDAVIERAADAVEMIVRDGVEAAMGLYNQMPEPE
ncbi:MAG TPA: aminoacyl-tRNA hydrolase [Acidimicrobiales bacterium]|nr:aminoacyl-tRNA hydrolase [Acidimicrobiales bacterium]